MNILKKISGAVLVLSVVLPVAVFAQDSAQGMMKECAPGALFSYMTGARCPGNTTSSKSSVAYDGACASAAVIAEENSMQALHDTFEATMKTVAMARRDALGAAFLNTDTSARNTAIKAARDAFQTAEQVAQKTMMTGQKSLMDSFKTTMQGCGVVGMGDLNMGRGDQMGGGMQNGDNGSMMGQGKPAQTGKSDKKDQGKKLPPKPGYMMGGDNQKWNLPVKPEGDTQQTSPQ